MSNEKQVIFKTTDSMDRLLGLLENLNVVTDLQIMAVVRDISPVEGGK